MKLSNANDIKNKTLKELKAMYNSHCEAGKEVKKFSSKAIAIKRTLKVLNLVEQGNCEIPTPAGKVELVVLTSLKKLDLRPITVLVDENPKLKGSKSHKRFKLYSKHTTVGEYKAAGGYAADLRWDSEHGYITY